ncbi:MAG: poly-beta-1,6 N-acetyl-D-glucosamine export porin PgaA [Pseudomonadota bacterium]
MGDKVVELSLLFVPVKNTSGLRVLQRSLTVPMLVALLGASSAGLADARDAAVAVARDGDPAGGADRLEALYQASQTDSRILNDLIVVSIWAKRTDRAVELARLLSFDATPPYVLRPLARTARDAKQFSLAQRAYAELARRDPDPQWLFASAMAKAEGGNVERAETDLDALWSTHRNQVAYHRARAYVHRLGGDHIKAAGAYADAIALAPEDRDTRRLQIINLAELGAPHLAARVLSQYPSVLSEAERDRVLGDRAAIQIRWGSADPNEPPHRFRRTDRALRHLKEVPRARSASTRRTASDQVVALRDRVRMAEAASLYETLDDSNPIPTYVRLAAADAYLYLEQPETALALYDGVLKERPGHFEASVARFFALIDLERHHDAQAQIDKLLEAEPVWLKSADEKTVRANPKRERTAVLSGLARAFGDDLADGHRRLSDLVANAPLNPYIQSELATVERWRGWPRRAYHRYVEVLDLEPNLLTARVGAANAQFDAARWADAQASTLALLAEYPEHKAVQRLGHRLRQYHAPLFDHRFRIDSSDGGAVKGSNSVDAHTRGWSGALHTHYRVTARHRFSRATFAEGRTVRNRFGVGGDFRRGNWRAAAELSAGSHDHDRIGVSAQVLWRTDHWRVGTGFETASDETPLRGMRVGVNAARAFAEFGYRASELLDTTIAINYLDLNDRNERISMAGALRGLILNRPGNQIHLRLGLYGSLNDRDQVSYFSPTSDWSVDLELQNDLRLYRRYQRALNVRWWAGIGRYWQDDFGTNATWQFGAELRWRINRDANLAVGLSRAERVYDDTPEHNDAFFAHLEWHL